MPLSSGLYGFNRETCYYFSCSPLDIRYHTLVPFKIFTQFTIFLVLGVASYFILKLGHFL